MTLSSLIFSAFAVEFGEQADGAAEIFFGHYENKLGVGRDDFGDIDAGSRGDRDEREESVRNVQPFRVKGNCDGGQVFDGEFRFRAEVFFHFGYEVGRTNDV